VDQLPEGWLGKVYPVSVGAARAAGDWLLLSDADVHIAPERSLGAPIERNGR
jgi:hypothetical protein